jgi:hypothetical protein
MELRHEVRETVLREERWRSGGYNFPLLIHSSWLYCTVDESKQKLVHSTNENVGNLQNLPFIFNGIIVVFLQQIISNLSKSDVTCLFEI